MYASRGGVGRHERGSEPELLAQPDAVGLLHQERIGPRVDRESVDLLAQDHAAGTRRALEHDESDAALLELVGDRQPRDPAADDHGVVGHVSLSEAVCWCT